MHMTDNCLTDEKEVLPTWPKGFPVNQVYEIPVTHTHTHTQTGTCTHKYGYHCTLWFDLVDFTLPYNHIKSDGLKLQQPHIENANPSLLCVTQSSKHTLTVS